MLKHGLRVGVVALGSATALGMAGVAGSAGVAGASTAAPQSLSSIQAKAEAAITLRVNDLHAAITKVSDATNLGSEQAALESYLNTDIGPLNTLYTEVQNATTVQQAQDLDMTIYTGYRVLALVLPASGLAGRSAVMDNADLPALNTDYTNLSARVNPSNQAQLAPLLSDLEHDINAATALTTGLPSTVLAFSPSDWNANHEVLAPAHADLETAAGDVKSAHSYVQQIRTILKAGKSSAPTPAAEPAVPATTPTTTVPATPAS